MRTTLLTTLVVAATVAAPAFAADDGACEGAGCASACDKQGRSKDCLKAGEMYRNGEGVRADPAKAARFLKKSCDKKNGEACFLLVDLTDDPAKKLALHGTGCEGGKGECCDRLSQAYEKGDGVAKDHAKAIELLGKACAATDYQVWSCNSLHKAVAGKDPLAVAIAEGWTKACAATKDEKACESSGRLAEAAERLKGK